MVHSLLKETLFLCMGTRSRTFLDDLVDIHRSGTKTKSDLPNRLYGDEGEEPNASRIDKGVPKGCE